MSVKILVEVVYSIPLSGCIRFNQVYVVVDMGRYSAFCDRVSVLNSYLFTLALEVFDVDARS